MLLLSCSGVARAFDRDPLFRDIEFELHAGERVGLVGPNGAGKTTLLRILAGLDEPDEGQARLHAGARIGLLSQQPDFTPGRSLFQEAKSALDEFLAVQDDLVRTAEALAATTNEEAHRALAARYDRLNEILRHHQAYTVDHRVEEILDGLGLQREDYDRAVETFSGGQQSRLMLAKMLLSSPDVMLLDEPSNHLDIDATHWLEEYLAQQPEGMIVVSHDRYFLNRVATKIFELARQRIASYPGNFEAYLRLRQERYEHQKKAWEAQQEYIEKQEDYIRRVHYGQSHKQAHSRQKSLDRLDLVERPTLISGPRMHFGQVKRAGDVIFQVDDLTKAYDRPLFTNLSFQLKRGKRLGIMGPNGSGKTTLLRILLGQEQPTSGTVQRGHQVEFGYYDQHLKALPEDKTAIRAAWPPKDPDATEQGMRDLLGRFGLMGDQAYQNVGALSGGERSRVALAKLVASGVNVLVLDEPTNHLDLWACDSLEQALLEFEGTAIVVSHDRYFLNRVVDQLIVIDDGRAQVIFGNYDTYEKMRAMQKGAGVAKSGGKGVDNAKATAGNEATSAQPGKVKRKRRFPYRKVDELEKDIADQERQLNEYEALLASPELYRDGDKVKETMRSFEEIKVTLQRLYEHWEEAVELN